MIGEKIRYMRKYRNMNQQELAEKLGVSRQYVSQIEKGRDSISVKKLQDILNILSFDMEFKPQKIK